MITDFIQRKSLMSEGKLGAYFFSKHPCLFGGELFAEGDTFHLNFEKQKRIIAVKKSNTLKQTVHD